MKDKFFLFLSLISLCALCFVAGAAVMHFYPNKVQGVRNAFLGAKGWELFVDKSIDDGRKPHKITKSLRGTVNKIDGKHYSGYTLLSVALTPIVQLIDDNGKIVYRWNVPFNKAWPSPTHINRNNPRTLIDTAYAYPNGDLLAQYYGSGDTPYGYGIAKFDKDSNVIWTFSENAHHDFYVSPDDGTISAIVQYFQKTPVKGFEHFSYPQLVDEIVALSPDGKIIDRIPILSALEGTPYADFYRKRSMKFIKKMRQNWDETHTNSVRRLTVDMAKDFPQFTAGDYLVNMRNNKGVIVISHKTKKAIWGVCCEWHGQHAAQFYKDGKIMLLDNYGIVRDGIRNSQVVLYDTNVNKKTVLYKGDAQNRFYTVSAGRLQLLPNGNILATESSRRKITEISPDGHIVWQYKMGEINGKSSTKGIHHATRYSLEYFTFLVDEL